MFKKLNQKYDKIENNNHRFLILLGLMMPGLILIGVEGATKNPAYWLAGMVYFLVMLTARVLYIEGGKKRKRNDNG